MNLFVADPHWGWWIILYFFFGGIAAGVYFLATLIDLVGNEEDQPLARLGYRVAFPLVALCGLLLIIDLDRPERFWHMLFKSAIVHEAISDGWPWALRSWPLMARAPLLKYWSPMSIGSWALALFGLCSVLSLLGSLWPDQRGMRWLRRGVIGRGVQLVGCLVGFFVASYTGALVTATNQPLWSDSTWIAPLFLTSAASTGSAALMLLAHARGCVPPNSLQRLERTDRWALCLESVVFLLFLAGLGALLVPILRTRSGQLLVAGTAIVGLVIPLGIHWRPRLLDRRSSIAAACCALLGGFVLRYSLLTTPTDLLALAPALAFQASVQEIETPAGFHIVPPLSPEDGRTPGSPGADPGNRPTTLHPRSKVFQEP